MTISRRQFLRAAGLVPAGIVLALSGCGRGRSTSASSSASENPDLYQPALYARPWITEPKLADHGEDYVIEWQNPALEQVLRVWLDRPTGDILHSDVWEIRYIDLSIGVGDSVFCLYEHPADGIAFTSKETTGRTDGRVEGVSFDGSPLTSLQDLRHFDSLQVLVLTGRSFEHPPISDFSGLEVCENLSMLMMLQGCAPATLEPLADCVALEFLALRGGDDLDLTPLATCTQLTRLSINDTRILSLEPLTELPLIHLDLSNMMGMGSVNNGLDYSPIAQLEQLRYICLTNNDSFTDPSVCAELENLEFFQCEYGRWRQPADFQKLKALLPQVTQFLV